VLAEELHHVAERGSTGASRGFDVDEFLEDRDSVLLCVVAQELHLSGYGETVALLLGGRDARVQDGRRSRFWSRRPSGTTGRAAPRSDLLSACHSRFHRLRAEQELRDMNQLVTAAIVALTEARTVLAAMLPRDVTITRVAAADMS
jgi:hypothetical protein